VEGGREKDVPVGIKTFAAEIKKISLERGMILDKMDTFKNGRRIKS